MNSVILVGNADMFVANLRVELPRLRELNDAYMKLEPNRAEWVGMAFDLAQVALLSPSPDKKEQAARLRQAVDGIRARAADDDAKWPEGDHYGPVRLICAMLDSDQKRSRATIADVTTKHASDAATQRLTRNVVLFRALMWKDNTGLDALVKTLQPSTDRNDRQFVLEVSAIRTDIKNVAAWARARPSVPSHRRPGERCRKEALHE